MRRIAFLVLPVVLSLTMTRCWVYKPMLADIPLIDHRGDMRVSASIFATPIPAYNDRLGHFLMPDPGVSSTFSMGVSDRAAVQMHSDLQGEVLYTHAAVGLYRPYDISVLEGYLGMGCGRGYRRLADEPSIKIYYLCPFVQVNYGWHLGTHWDVGVSMKVGDWIPFDIRGADGLAHPSQAPLLEPQVFLRVGGEEVKFQLQAGFTHLVGWPSSGELFYYPVSVGMGISIAK